MTAQLKEHSPFQSSSPKLSSNSVKTKKNTPRPSTPHGNKAPNFIERNRQAIHGKKKQHNDNSPPSSPQPTLRRASNGQPIRPNTPHRPVTPHHEKPAGLPRNARAKSGSGEKLSTSSPTQNVAASASLSHRPVSPPRSDTPASARPRASTPDKEVARLRALLNKRDELLREMDEGIKDAKEAIGEFQDSVVEIESANRTLQRENERLRSQIDELRRS